MATKGTDLDGQPQSPAPRGLREAQEAADLAGRRLQQALDVLPQGVVFLDAEHRYIMWNQKYAEIYTRSADLMAPGRSMPETLRMGVARGDYPDAAGREEAWLGERVALLENPGLPHEQRLSNGRWIMIEERKTQDGGTIGLRVDITDMKMREESFRLLFASNPVPMLVYDPATESIEAANDVALSHFGYDAAGMEGMQASGLFDPRDWPDACRLLAADVAEENRFWRQFRCDGSLLESVLFTRKSVIAGKPVVIVAVFDVTERRKTEARMAYMARHDELTGLANRAQCREMLYEACAHSKLRDSITVAMIDLDHFKAVNDTHGHLVGDALLAEAARRMQAEIPTSALLCRIGGDEFAVLFRRASGDQVELVAKSIITALSRPFFINDLILHIGGTVGSATGVMDSDDPETLLRFADLALYSAKLDRRGSYRRFTADMDLKAQEKAQLEGDFRRAVRLGELDVHYQPLVNLGTGALEGYEALLRWNHPQLGDISPGMFVPMAEELGLIDTLGQFVLQTACREAIRWAESVVLSVNVSPLQFRNRNLVNVVMQALSSSGLPPHRLELEITEAVLMDRSTATSSNIRSLRSLGVGLSMDDFGTGYSSLSYLLSYPFSKIKIDKSFVLNLEDEESSRAVIRAVIGLGRSLGMTVTAEGIEQESVRQFLQDEGCCQGQGFLFGKAKPASEVAPAKARDAA